MLYILASNNALCSPEVDIKINKDWRYSLLSLIFYPSDQLVTLIIILTIIALGNGLGQF